MSEQLNLVLACGPRGRRSIQQAFDEWLSSREGRVVLREVIARARRLAARGHGRYSIDAVCHSIRFDRDVKLGPSQDEYRLNNNVTSRLARRVMSEAPDLAGFFEIRRLTSG